MNRLEKKSGLCEMFYIIEIIMAEIIRKIDYCPIRVIKKLIFGIIKTREII